MLFHDNDCCITLLHDPSDRWEQRFNDGKQPSNALNAGKKDRATTQEGAIASVDTQTATGVHGRHSDVPAGPDSAELPKAVVKRADNIAGVVETQDDPVWAMIHHAGAELIAHQCHLLDEWPGRNYLQ